MCMNTFPKVPETLKLLRFVGIEFFFFFFFFFSPKQLCILVSRKVTIRKFKMVYFETKDVMELET